MYYPDKLVGCQSWQWASVYASDKPVVFGDLPDDMFEEIGKSFNGEQFRCMACVSWKFNKLFGFGWHRWQYLSRMGIIAERVPVYEPFSNYAPYMQSHVLLFVQEQSSIRPVMYNTHTGMVTPADQIPSIPAGQFPRTIIDTRVSAVSIGWRVFVADSLGVHYLDMHTGANEWTTVAIADQQPYRGRPLQLGRWGGAIVAYSDHTCSAYATSREDMEFQPIVLPADTERCTLVQADSSHVSPGLFLYPRGKTDACLLDEIGNRSVDGNTRVLFDQWSTTVCTVNGVLYLLGHERLTMIRYSFIERKWHPCARIPQKRDNAVLLVVGKFIYLFGGYETNKATRLRLQKAISSKVVERYDTDTDKWEILQDTPRELGRVVGAVQY